MRHLILALVVALVATASCATKAQPVAADLVPVPAQEIPDCFEGG